MPKVAFWSCVSSAEGGLAGSTERAHLHKQNPVLGLLRTKTVRSFPNPYLQNKVEMLQNVGKLSSLAHI